MKSKKIIEIMRKNIQKILKAFAILFVNGSGRYLYGTHYKLG